MLRTDIVRLASRFGRYGYRQITNLLHIEDWHVNHKRVERIWHQEGLQVPRRQPKRGRLWLGDGSCILLRLPLALIFTLAPALATNSRFTLPLTLAARLLIVPTLAQFGVQTRTLHLTLEAPQRAVEALVILDDYFQDDHAP